MKRRRKLIIALVALLGGTVLVAAVLVLVLTQTDWGREQVRRQIVGILGGTIKGRVAVGRISGNLLKGVTIEKLSITDSAGVPFLVVDSAQARYALGGFIGKKLWFDDVRLVRPLLLFDKPNGGEWNVSRLFAGDSTKPDDPNRAPGFGSWFRLSDVEVVQGRVQVRGPFAIDTTGLTVAQRDSVIRAALAGEGTAVVVRDPRGGYQKVTDMRDLDARLPLIVINDPDMDFMEVRVATANTIAQVFAGPAADIRDVRGTFRFNPDSTWFDGVQAAFPSSRLVGGSGRYYGDRETLLLRAKAPQAAFADFRWAYPPFPSEGGGSLDYAMAITDTSSTFDVRNANVVVGRSKLRGDLVFTLHDVADTIAFRDTRLVAEDFDTALLEQLIPGLDLPRRGRLTGRIAMEGGLYALNLDTDVTYDDDVAGRSRIVAKGEVGFDTTMVRARDLSLRLLPVQVALLRTALPDLPVGGTVSGTAFLDGRTDRELRFRTDLAHLDRGARSAVAASGLVGFGRTPRFDVRGDLKPLSLVTAGRFAPAIGLRGTAAGPVTLRGTMDDLRFDARLRTADGGVLAAAGRAALDGPRPRYDVRAAATLFNANVVVASMPATQLTGTATARGTGFDPATANAVLEADLRTSRYEDFRVDSLRARLSAAGGLLTVRDLAVRLEGARADVRGTFGLAAGRTGDLTYLVELDSLNAFRRYLPTDTGEARPTAARVAAAVRRARADSTRMADATELSRAIEGGPPVRLQVDTPSTVRRDSVAGALRAAGRVQGSLDRFALRGRASAAGLVVAGSTARRARAEYALEDASAKEFMTRTRVVAALQADSVTVSGFALDSVDARVSYRKPGGTAEVAVFQDDAREYSARADFTFLPERNLATFNDLRLRLDTTTWRSTRPGAVAWGPRGIEVETIDLRSGEFGRIYADGLIPTTGDADLTVAVANFEVGSVLSLLQSDVDAAGMVSLSARLGGTLEAPVLRGGVGGTLLRYNGGDLPDVRGTFDYAGGRLASRVEARRPGRDPARPVLVADLRMPANLAVRGATGERFPDEPLEADIRLDSLDLAIIPQFTDLLADTRGVLAGEVKVRGQRSRPSLNGQLAVDAARARIVPAGVTLDRVVGRVRMERDTVVLVDSIVAYSAGGRILLNGTVGVGSFREPRFALVLTARGARVLDNDRGRLRADANIRASGLLTRLDVSGNLGVREGVVYLPEDGRNPQVLSAGDPTVFAVADTALADERALLPEENALLAGLQANVTVLIDRNVWVRSRAANVEVFTDGDLAIVLQRGVTTPSLAGVLSTERGEYEFLGKRFQIRRGAATFIGGPRIDPLIQATGEYEVRLAGREAMQIRLLIGGTAFAPRLVVESDAQPPIAQSDLLSYLAFGRPSSSLLQQGGSGLSGGGAGGSLVGATQAIARTQLPAIAIGTLVEELEAQAGQALGADVFNIAPADIPTELFSGSNISAFVLSSEVEYGRYFTPRQFGAVLVRPIAILGTGATTGSPGCTPNGAAPPGLRYEYRAARGLRVETSFSPRYILGPPTLGAQCFTITGQFGAFVIREWRF